MRPTLPILVILALVAVSGAQKLRFTQLQKYVILERERYAPADSQGRKTRIRQLFVQAGCSRDNLTEQAVPGSEANVICRLPGKSKQTIIVGANYSPAPPDNWSGASLLPSLFQSLAGKKRRHTVVFVAFAGEKRDLSGAEFFASHLTPAEMERTEAMVNLDALGISPTKISARDSDKELVKSFMAMVYVMKLMASQVDISRGIRVDSEPFASRHIPQITIHSLTKGDVAGLNGQNGQTQPTEAQFRPDNYYDSYHLISAFLVYLDEILKPRPQSK
jgi:hypothetical protein